MSRYRFEKRTPSLDPTVFIAPSAQVIGEVTIGAFSSVWYQAVLRGDIFPIVVGSKTNIQDLSVGHVTGGEWSLLIGDEVTIGHRAIIHGCTIHDRCLIGMGAIIMDGAKIGPESLIGAGALVTAGTEIPPRTLAVGSPAKIKRDLTPAEIELLKESADHYVALAKRHREGLKPLG